MATQESQAFVETYKMAYSHGLETIYALQDINPLTIRKLNSSANVTKEPTAKKPHQAQQSVISDAQLYFDFGPPHREWIEPFLALEPIQVLGLSRLAEKGLLENQKTTLNDLIDGKLTSSVFLKGIGQGHLDEIQTKLEQYIAGRSLTASHSLDFCSWIRCLVASCDRKKAAALLQSFSEGSFLKDILMLTPMENAELLRLNETKRAEWFSETRLHLYSSDKHSFVIKKMREVVEAFIKPWIRRRYGMATEQELYERMRRVSENPAHTLPALRFFSEIYFEGKCPLKQFLPRMDTWYCANDAITHDISEVIQLALSYFYKTDISYTLSELEMYVKRELAKAWKGFPEGFIEKILRFSSPFRVRKGPDNKLIVRLATQASFSTLICTNTCKLI